LKAELLSRELPEYSTLLDHVMNEFRIDLEFQRKLSTKIVDHTIETKILYEMLPENVVQELFETLVSEGSHDQMWLENLVTESLESGDLEVPDVTANRIINNWIDENRPGGHW